MEIIDKLDPSVEFDPESLVRNHREGFSCMNETTYCLTEQSRSLEVSAEGL